MKKPFLLDDGNEVDNVVAEVKKSELDPRKITAILVLLFLIASVTTAFFYNEARRLEQDPAKINQERVAALVSRVEKLIVLPEGELPTVATIADIAPLAGNPFFARAKVGDHVLFYTAARRAFLYDPTANIIVEVASLNIGR